MEPNMRFIGVVMNIRLFLMRIWNYLLWKRIRYYIGGFIITSRYIWSLMIDVKVIL